MLLLCQFFPPKRRQGSTRKISFDDVNLQIVTPAICFEFLCAVKRYVDHYSYIIRMDFFGLNLSPVSGERAEYVR